jgi:hypothetical protein
VVYVKYELYRQETLCITMLNFAPGLRTSICIPYNRERVGRGGEWERGEGRERGRNGVYGRGEVGEGRGGAEKCYYFSSSNVGSYGLQSLLHL